MEKSFCFMIQARVGSTRLPKKMTLPFFEDKTILQLIIEKLQKGFPAIPIVLATSEQGENEVLVQTAKAMGCSVFQGSEHDVLQRFIEAATFFQQTNIVRICADNPFLDTKELQRLLAYASGDIPEDYVSFQIDNTPSIKTHYGFWTEFVTLEALRKVTVLTDDSLYHEHVTNYIYAHEKDFKTHFLPANPKVQNQKNIRMTLDTAADFSVLSQIYTNLHQRYGADFGIDEIVGFLEENPAYKASMAAQIIANTK